MPGGIHAPIEEILKWPTPNYVNPTIRPNTILLMSCILGPFTLAMLLARLWVRIFYQRNAGWDDWLIIAGTVPTIAATILFPLAKNSGFDRHIWDLNILKNPELGVAARKYVLALLCIFSVASGLIKISILLFFRRLSSRVISNRFRWATWITITFIGLTTIALTLTPIFGCDPIPAFWEQSNYKVLAKGYKYHCFNEGAEIFSASVISTVQDLITAILPTFLYWNLRIPIRQKIALFGIFAIGYGVAALGAMRAYFSWQIYFSTYDVTWVTWDLLIVTMLELHVGCFCANAPTLKVFFKHFFHEKLTSSAKQSKASGQKDKSSGTHSSKSSASMLKEKVSDFFFKGSNTHSRDGYLSEPHTDISVDPHGGVQVQREVHITESPAPASVEQSTHRDLRESVDTTDMIYAQYYDDIELGRFTTTRNSRVSSSQYSEGNFDDADIEALPSLPRSPRSPQSMRSFVSFYRNSKSPRASTQADWPSRPLPATIAEERHNVDSRSSLHPPRSISHRKPDWQTWT